MGDNDSISPKDALEAAKTVNSTYTSFNGTALDHKSFRRMFETVANNAPGSVGVGFDAMSLAVSDDRSRTAAELVGGSITGALGVAVGTFLGGPGLGIVVGAVAAEVGARIGEEVHDFFSPPSTPQQGGLVGATRPGNLGDGTRASRWGDDPHGPHPESFLAPDAV